MIIPQINLVFFSIAEYFPFITDTTARQPALVTAKAILNATLVHYRRTNTLRYTRSIVITAYTLYWDNLLSLCNFLSHYKIYLGID